MKDEKKSAWSETCGFLATSRDILSWKPLDSLEEAQKK